jgi:hypothetical protein
MASAVSTKPSGTVTELLKSGSELTASIRKSLSPLRVHSLSAIGFSDSESASATVLFSVAGPRSEAFCETKLFSESAFFSDFEFAPRDALSSPGRPLLRPWNFGLHPSPELACSVPLSDRVYAPDLRVAASHLQRRRSLRPETSSVRRPTRPAASWDRAWQRRSSNPAR